MAHPALQDQPLQLVGHAPEGGSLKFPFASMLAAFALVQDPAFLYGAARCAQRLDRLQEALADYERYLVLENDDAYHQHGIDRKPDPVAKTPAPARSGWGWTEKNRSPGKEGLGSESRNEVTAAGPAQRPAAVGPADSAEVPVFAREDAGNGDEASGLYAARRTSGRKGLSRASEAEIKSQFEMQDGKDAVKLSKAIDEYKKADSPRDNIAPMVKQVGKKIFYLANGVWIDRDYKADMKTIKVKYASDEYFKLITDKPELKKYLALGEKVIVCLDDKTAVVVE